MSWFWNHRTGNASRTKLGLIALLLIGFGIRLAYGFWSYDPSNFVDELDYLGLAEVFLQEGLFTNNITEEYYTIGPVWPGIIAISTMVFGPSHYPIIIFNALLATGTIWVIFHLGKFIKNAAFGLFCAFWATFYVLLFKYTGTILKENLLQFLFPFSILQLLWLSQRPKEFWNSLFLFTLTFSILIHADERYFFYTPLIVLGLVALDIVSTQLGMIKALAFSGLLVLFMIPWLIRNYQMYEQPIILTIRTAPFTSKLLGYPTIKVQGPLSSYQHSALPIYEAITDSLRNGKAVKSKGIKYITGIKKALDQGINVYTFSPVKNYWEEFKELWRPVRFRAGMVANGYRLQERRFWYSNLIYGLNYGLLLPFLLLASYQSLRNWNKPLIFLLAILIIHTIIHVFLAHARMRYRIPIDPFVISLALLSMVSLASKLTVPYHRFLPWLTKE